MLPAMTGSPGSFEPGHGHDHGGSPVGITNADALLSEAELSTDVEAVGLLALAAAEINREIQAGGDNDRVRKLVERLQTVAREVAHASRAATFSVSAGFPAGVGVTIEWSMESRTGLM
jgi:hypothetical protein